MTSAIDPTVPVAGTPTTASVRANFQTAHDEITALQGQTAALPASNVTISPTIGALGPNVQAALTTVNNSFAPLASPNLTGDPKVPTAAEGDSDTSAASTLFVQTAVAPAVANTGRNYIINSMFRVWQRGSAGGFQSPGYTADRWYMNLGPSDIGNFSQATATDGQRAMIGEEVMETYLGASFTGNAASDSFVALWQNMEKVRRLAGKTIIVSFYAQCAPNMRFGVSLSQTFGSGGSPSPTVGVPGQSVAVTATLARYSLIFNMPSANGKTVGTNGDDTTSLLFWYSTGSANQSLSGGVPVQNGALNLWGVQVEIAQPGQTRPSPIERLSLREDFDNCCRFYQTIYCDHRSYTPGSGVFSSSWNYPVQPRAVPSLQMVNITYTSATGLSISTAGRSNACVLWASATAAGDAEFGCDVLVSAEI